jgi:pimeloyl-ACP methyl ester carboxylesterase
MFSITGLLGTLFPVQICSGAPRRRQLERVVDGAHGGFHSLRCLGLHMDYRAAYSGRDNGACDPGVLVSGVSRAVPRYFNSSSFRAEWLARRNRLLKAWQGPVLIVQGYNSKTQPREFYEKAAEYIPNASNISVSYLPGGHFWTLESPTETTAAIHRLLSM